VYRARGTVAAATGALVDATGTVVDAGGTVGTAAAVKAPADGYTLLVPHVGLAFNETLYPKRPYNAIKDLAPVSKLGETPNSVVVNNKFPVKSIQDLIALAKKQPGKIPYASSGAGGQQHLAMESVRALGGIDLVHVPYKGFGQGVTDVLANQVPLIFGGVTASIAYVGGGKLKALGVTSAKRVKALPGVPAIAETLPGFESEAFFSVVAPPKTPMAIVNKVNADINEALRQPEVLARLAKLSAEVVGGTQEQTAAYFRAEVIRWQKVIKAANVKLP
jgi:tripartite-type tricarboxylate transporter receptor subunit TctC